MLKARVEVGWANSLSARSSRTEPPRDAYLADRK